MLAQIHQGIEYKPLLRGIGESERQLLIGLVLIINVIVPHVYIQHPVMRIGPGHRVITTMPYFMLLGACTQGKLVESIDKSIFIAGFLRRSFSQLYHSLGADLKVAGRCCVMGCLPPSTLNTADVGRQVFPLYCPAPKNWSWYQSQFCG